MQINASSLFCNVAKPIIKQWFITHGIGLGPLTLYAREVLLSRDDV